MIKGFYKKPSGWTYMVREDLKYLGFGKEAPLSEKIGLDEKALGEGFGLTKSYKDSHSQAKLVVPKEFT